LILRRFVPWRFGSDSSFEETFKATRLFDWLFDIVVCKSLVQFSGFSEFGGENTQISLKFGANRANI